VVVEYFTALFTHPEPALRAIGRHYVSQGSARRSQIKQAQVAEGVKVEQSAPKAACVICGDDLSLLQLATLSDRCAGGPHWMCHGCLSETLKMILHEAQFPARCPQCKADDAKADSGAVSEMKLAALVEQKVLSLSDAGRFRQQQLLAALDGGGTPFTHCPNRNCKLLVALDGGLEGCVSTLLVCPHCYVPFCAPCSVPYHRGMSCRQFRAAHVDEQKNQALFDATSKPCPNCRTRITHYKHHGCHHIRPGSGCPGCHHHWCYNCSGSWSGCDCAACRMLATQQRQKTACHCGVLFCSDKCACPECPDCAAGRPCAAS
jgi:hypothetical protein